MSLDVTDEVVVGTLLLLVMLIGIIGVVVPVLPGLALINAAVLGWALYDRGTWAWVALGVCLLLWAAAFVLQYLLPGKRLVAAGVPTWVLLLAGLTGLVGFFVVPVIGLPLFFVGTVFLLQHLRARNLEESLGSTWQALGAVLLSVAIELTAAVLSISVYLGAFALR